MSHLTAPGRQRQGDRNREELHGAVTSIREFVRWEAAVHVSHTNAIHEGTMATRANSIATEFTL